LLNSVIHLELARRVLAYQNHSSPAGLHAYALRVWRLGFAKGMSSVSDSQKAHYLVVGRNQ